MLMYGDTKHSITFPTIAGRRYAREGRRQWQSSDRERMIDRPVRASVLVPERGQGFHERYVRRGR